MPMSDATRIRVSPDVLFQEVNGETVLLDLASERYFGLDAVGTVAWGVLEAGGDLGTAVETLLQRFEVDRHTARADLESLLDELAGAGLVALEH